MSVELTRELEALIAEMMKSGQYSSPEQVVGAALRLLASNTAERARKVAEIKAALQEGDDDIAADRCVTLTNPEGYAQLASDIRSGKYRSRA